MTSYAAEEEQRLTAEQWKAKGDEAFKLRMYEAATEHYSHAIEEEPENYLYYYQRALVLTFRGRSHLAIEDFNSVLALNPAHSSVGWRSFRNRDHVFLLTTMLIHALSCVS